MDTGRAAVSINSIRVSRLRAALAGTRLAHIGGGRKRMELVTQVATAVSGMAVAFGASRLVLQGVLAVTFGRKRS
jgi:hypothetical protein